LAKIIKVNLYWILGNDSNLVIQNIYGEIIKYWADLRRGVGCGTFDVPRTASGLMY
jgi:hypothetical protein